MPPLTRWSIRLSLGWLIVGGLAQIVATLPSGVPMLGVQATHALVFGWLTQVVVGVSYWLFPRQPGDRPRGFTPLGWFVVVALNLGLLLRIVGEPWALQSAETLPRTILLFGAFAQLAAAVAYAALILPRVRGK